MNGESTGNTARFVKNARAMLPRTPCAGKEEKREPTLAKRKDPDPGKSKDPKKKSV